MSKSLIARAEELTRQAATKRAEAKVLSQKPEMTVDESKAFDALCAEADAIDQQASEVRARAEKAEANESALAGYTSSVGRKSDPSAVREPMVAKEGITEDPKRGYRSLAEFAADVFAAGPAERAHNDRLRILAAAQGMNQSTGAEGGFAVPPTFATSIWDGMRNDSANLLERTDRYTVEGESLTLLANAETSRATGSRYGGVRGYWISEAAQVTKSTPTLRQLKLNPNQLGVLVYVTDKLLRNQMAALDQYLVRAATEEISFLVNDAIVNGDGSGKPLGVLNAGCLVSVSKETGQAAATILPENVNKMWSRLHSRSWANAAWYINQDVLPQLQQLSQTVGVGGMPVFLPPNGMAGAPNGTLLGRPVIPIEHAATLGTVGDIVLADLSAYASGVQGTVEQAQSMHLRFDYAETAFRFLFAVDGQPWLASAITPFKGSNTQSPFVALATRS